VPATSNIIVLGRYKLSNPGVTPVAIGLEDKKAIVAEVNETATSALSLIIADSRGVTVDGMTALRQKARENQVTLRVVRNTLAKRALAGTEYECVNDILSGPSLFGFSMEDPGAAARIFKDFAKANKDFEVKALAVSGQMLGADQLDVLAKLPTRDQALSILMSVMKAPVTKLVQTMNEVPGKLVRTLAAVRDQKETAA
jgi:large subunit ribosomal protein L10|tara:strand:+ start:1856 stop:2452 length:597 start_codon:yes stop_codon:yes gene_type:complete